jgi:hypothetical protein
VQNWNAEVHKRNARFVSDLGMPVVELLNPQPAERILDLGCGDGAPPRNWRTWAANRSESTPVRSSFKNWPKDRPNIGQYRYL